MLKIVARRRGEREIVDRTLDRQEARFMLAEYGMAFGPEWTVQVAESAMQSKLEEVVELRRQGLTQGPILEATGLNLDTYNHLVKLAVDEGLIERRKAGTKEKFPDRNQQVIDMRKAGTPIKEIAEKLGMKFFTLRTLIYKLQKSGRLPRGVDNAD